MSSTVKSRKRAYRYAVTRKSGSGERAVGDSPFVVDWKYLGREYDWNIYDFSKSPAERTGFFSGTFVDKGWLIGGEFFSDADICDACGAKGARESKHYHDEGTRMLMCVKCDPPGGGGE